MHVCGVIKQIWTEYLYKSTSHFINFLPPEYSLLQTLYREPSDSTVFQSILWSALFETQQFHPLILFESWLRASLILLMCNAIMSFGNRKNSHGAKSGELGGWEWPSFCLSQKFTHRQSRVSRCIVTVEKQIIWFSLFRLFSLHIFLQIL